jgi:predicted nucleotidyltransferase
MQGMQGPSTPPSFSPDRPITRQELLARSEQALQSCLRRHLPAGTAVFLFGSRARGDHRWNSDFDLWIDADIDRGALAAITDELEESFVPYKVDLVTTPELGGDFAQQVRKEAVRWL